MRLYSRTVSIPAYDVEKGVLKCQEELLVVFYFPCYSLTVVGHAGHLTEMTDMTDMTDGYRTIGGMKKDRMTDGITWDNVITDGLTWNRVKIDGLTEGGDANKR